MIKKGVLFLTGVALAFVLGLHVLVHAGAQGQAAQRLSGTWRLTSYHATSPADLGRGANPTGLLYYDNTGHMAAQIMPDRPRPKYAAAAPTPEEAKAALTGYSAYFGTYRVDEAAHTVTHHRLGSIIPGDVGGDFVRRYEFVGADRLVLTPLEGPGRQITWDRIR
jgi:hypothetical protein